MPDLQYGTSSFELTRGNLPEIPVVNMFAEQIPIETNVVLQSRPGLEDTALLDGDTSSNIQALFQVDGVLNGEIFGIVSGLFFRVNADDSVNTFDLIDGTGPVAMAGFENRVFACAGANAWQFDGTSLTEITTPDTFQVLSLCVGSDRLIVIDEGTGHFYWSDVLSPTIEDLSFATAENSPDKLKELLFLGDTLLLFGSETVEQWPASSSNPDLPFTPLVGRTYQVGVRNTGCATLFKGSFAWITNHNQICVGDPNTVVSDVALEEKLSNSTYARLWKFWIEGIEFLAVTLDDSTHVFSSRSSQWSTFESYGEANWIPVCYSNGIFGSGIANMLLQWSDDYSDLGGVLERRFRAGMPVTTGTVPLYNLTLRTNPGQTPYLTGDYANPSVEMRTSRDGGFTWGAWKDKSLGDSGTLGEEGAYRKVIKWKSLGYFGYPAVLVEFRCTDPVPFRVSGVVVNEDYGGI